MKRKYVIALVIFCLTIFFALDFADNNVVEVRATINNMEGKNAIKVTTINEETDKYKIQAFVPQTRNEKLNEIINKKITKYIDNFKTENENNLKKVYLTIKFDTYEYEDYISFLFTYILDTGGAHENTFFSSINFDLKKDEEITIDTLVAKNRDFLNTLSKYTYSKLKENQSIVQGGIEWMLKDGTAPTKENFKTFVFSEEGLKIFFEKYQVAPYYLGEFSVVLPYSDFSK